METWIALALLGGMVSAEAAPIPAAQTSYTMARQQAISAKKPIAVFVGRGADAIREKIARMDNRIRRVLTQDYVVLVVDRETPQGTRLAQDLQINSDNGLVISDRTTTLQAFSHDGEVTESALQVALVKYADPEVKVVATETPAAATIAPVTQTVVPTAAPAYYTPYSNYSYCPNCRRR